MQKRKEQPGAQIERLLANSASLGELGAKLPDDILMAIGGWR